ncbi:hypothetical protein [Nonomuraea sp. NPDC050783]|uniref:hypothetical protein n=1 Tax=Nonomuraea sp. NPDC050783 TaxID=3154634 RepID=UPI0034660D37
MPMEDVGRLLDTLDEGYAEATGEQPAVPAHDPGTEVIPGTGQYQRPPQPLHQQPQQQHAQPLDERPTAALSPNDVLVARGPAPQDKLVAGFGENTVPREQPAAYGDRLPFTGPQYVESTGPQPRYTGDPFSGPQYTGDPAGGPQQQYPGESRYTGDPFSGPQYTSEQPQYQQPQPDRFGGPQYTDNEPVYQLPGTAEQRRPSPISTDPLGFPSPAADPYAAAAPAQPYPSDTYGRRQDSYAQPPQPQSQDGGGAGLGTPMHGIPGAGRRRAAPQQPVRDDYRDDYAAYQQPQAQQPQVQQPQGHHSSQAQHQPNPVDPLLALGRQEQYPPQPDQGMSRPYVGDPMFSTGERLRPEQPDYHERSDRREW